MPVLITGATGLVGRALAQRLLDEGGQVRAFVRRDDDALRAAGVHLAIGPMCDVERLESALTQVHTIVHLIGGFTGDLDDLNRESTDCAVIAARAAEVRRFVLLSYRGADPASPNAFLAAKGAAEQLVIGSGLEYAVIRSGPIIEGLPALAEHFRRGPVLTLPGSGEQVVGAVTLDAVVEALLRADERETEVRTVEELPGEDAPLAELLDRAFVEGRRVWARGLARGPIAELLARGVGTPA